MIINSQINRSAQPQFKALHISEDFKKQFSSTTYGVENAIKKNTPKIQEILNEQGKYKDHTLTTRQSSYYPLDVPAIEEFDKNGEYFGCKKIERPIGNLGTDEFLDIVLKLIKDFKKK